MSDKKFVLTDLDTEELWSLLTDATTELKIRGEIKGRNVVGDRGEMLAVTVYNETPNLPKLQLAPPSTQNIDAISTKGDRYSVKTISFPNKTTGVFHGYGTPEDPIDKQLFEYLIIVVLDGYKPLKIVELKWFDFYRLKKWHSTMRAYNISLTQEVIQNCRIILG